VSFGSNRSSSAHRTEQLMLEAILDGDGESWRNYITALPGDEAYGALTVATSAAVFRKWPDDPSLQAIADYVSEIIGRYPAEMPLARATIESVIRGAFGETELLDGTRSEEIILAEILLIRSIGLDVLTSKAQRESFLAEVLAAID
jgi:hypothetical protein